MVITTMPKSSDDGHGLTEEERSTHCKNLLKWILEDWMPWAGDNPDYSLLHVNRQGFCELLNLS